MLSRTAVSRASQLALRRQSCAQAQVRGYAAAASSGTFEAFDVAGVSVVAKDGQGLSTKLAVVAKAGTRYQPAPGLTAGLEAFAFKVRLTPHCRPGHPEATWRGLRDPGMLSGAPGRGGTAQLSVLRKLLLDDMLLLPGIDQSTDCYCFVI